MLNITNKIRNITVNSPSNKQIYALGGKLEQTLLNNESKHIDNSKNKISFTSNSIGLNELANAYYMRHKICMPLDTPSFPDNKENTEQDEKLKKFVSTLNSHINSLIIDGFAPARFITSNIIAGPNLSSKRIYENPDDITIVINSLKESGIDTIVYFRNSKADMYQDFVKNNTDIDFISLPSEEIEGIKRTINGEECEKEFFDFFVKLSELVKRRKIYLGCDYGYYYTSIMLYYLSVFCDEFKEILNDGSILSYFHQAYKNIEKNYNLLKRYKAQNEDV